MKQNIEQILNTGFSHSSTASWYELAKKQLKTDNPEPYLNYANSEGLELKSFSHELNTSFELQTFPHDVSLLLATEANFDENLLETLLKELGNYELYKDKAQIEASSIHNSGGDLVTELSYIMENVQKHLSEGSKNLSIELSLDSASFLSIAKLRALRFMLESYYRENSIEPDFQIIAVPSLREQTIFDPWMNMLRVCNIISSALIGGANKVVTYSYDYLFALLNDKTPSSLAVRNAINSFNILVKESKLTGVLDPSRGSYSIESISSEIISKVHKRLIENADSGKTLDSDYYSQLCLSTFEKRKQLVNTRKLTFSGVNNFANPTEDLCEIYKTQEVRVEGSKSGLFPLRRLTEHFESLRLRLSLQQHKLLLLVLGKESELSARIIFCQNYFELAGVEVVKKIGAELIDSTVKDYDLICICASDEQLDSKSEELTQLAKRKKLFISGKKTQVSNGQNIYMGQDIFSVLQRIGDQ